MRITPLRDDAGPEALYARFQETAALAGDRPLIEEPGLDRRMTGDELARSADALSDRLHEAGLCEREAALLSGLEGAEFLIASLAVWKCGAAVIAAGARVTRAETDRLTSAFRPLVLVTRAAGGSIEVHRGSVPTPLHPATALVKLTSGSTGLPRGIAVTAAQQVADGAHIIEGMGLEQTDQNIGAIPLSHSYGMGSLMMPLILAGIPLRLVNPASAAHLAEALSGTEQAIFPGVPYLFAMLGRADGPSMTRRGLRLCLSAGAPLAATVAAAFRSRHGLPVRAFYGTSETGGISFDASPDGDAAERDEGGVGSALPGVTIGCDAADGRIVISSASVASGYLGETSPFVGGRFVTGDLGRFQDGPAGPELVLTGRVEGLLNVAGLKVNPREIEQAILEIAGIREAAVIAEPDPARGDSPVACIAADGEVDASSVMAHLRARLSNYKIPRRIVFLPALPRGERGKIDVEALRSRVAL